MTIKVSLDKVFETVKKIKEEGKTINYMEDRYTFDRQGFLVKIEKEIDYQQVDPSFRFGDLHGLLFFLLFMLQSRKNCKVFYRKTYIKKEVVIMLVCKLLLVVLVYVALELVEKQAKIEDQHYLV